jgi:hypothetical protein
MWERTFRKGRLRFHVREAHFWTAWIAETTKQKFFGSNEHNTPR